MSTSSAHRARYLRALASPARLEVVEGLQIGGPSSVAELARRLGRAPSSLYHHLAQLESAGVIESRGRTTTAGQHGGRRGSVYHLKPGLVGAELDGANSKDERAAMAEMTSAVLRLTERDVGTALHEGPGALGELPIVQRSKAWLTPEDVAELTRLLTQVEDFLRARAEPDSTKRHLAALTFALTTLVPKAKPCPLPRSSPQSSSPAPCL